MRNCSTGDSTHDLRADSNPKAVKALLVHGADAKAKEQEHDQTALMWAAAESHPDVVAQLMNSARMCARDRVPTLRP